MAANRRSYLRELLIAAVGGVVPVVAIGPDVPAKRPAAWVMLGNRLPGDRDASGRPVTYLQAFGVAVFAEGAQKTEEAATEATNEAIDMATVAIEDYNWEQQETMEASGERITTGDAWCESEEPTVDGESGKGSAWITGVIEYTNR